MVIKKSSKLLQFKTSGFKGKTKVTKITFNHIKQN